MNGSDNGNKINLAARSRADHHTVTNAKDVLEARSKKRGLARILPFLGPSFIAAVAYIDPGNFATNIQSGAQYGYMLLWVVLWANLMAMLIQGLSAKMGIVTGRNLPENLRDNLRTKTARYFYWIQAEFMAIATDLAEFLGAAIGFHLLFGMSLMEGAVLTGIATFAILALQHYGFRPIEAVITVLVGVIAGAYLLEIIFSHPHTIAALQGMIIPRFKGVNSMYLAAGILGATVMPHVIYLHSALTQDRIATSTIAHKKRLLRLNLWDVFIAMGIAGFVNMAMLAMASATFYLTGHQDVASIETAYKTLTPLLGSAAAVVFAISLLASGISSSTVGTLAGQVVMQGFIGFTIPLWFRRLFTMIPSFVVIYLGLNPTAILVLSQVVLSFGIALAALPLLIYTGSDRIMGELKNNRLTQTAGWVTIGVIIVLNVFILVQTFMSM